MVTSSSPSDTHGTPARVLAFIRAAIALPVVAFAVAVYLLQSRGQPSNPAVGGAFDYAVIGISVVSLLTLFFVRKLYTAAPNRSQRASFAIVGWAVGEAPALFGVVAFFVAGDPLRMAPGLALLVISLLLFPIPADRPA